MWNWLCNRRGRVPRLGGRVSGERSDSRRCAGRVSHDSTECGVDPRARREDHCPVGAREPDEGNLPVLPPIAPPT